MSKDRVRRCAVLIELNGQFTKSSISAHNSEHPTDVALRLREAGFNPYRVQFDHDQSAWIVSTLDQSGRV